MKVGLHLPQLGRAASLEAIVHVATEAERLGFDDVWTADHVAVPVDLEGMPSFFPEPVPLLSAVAAHTSRVGLGTSVVIPAYRNPMHWAKQWATLDWLAPGRTILGVGAGWLEAEFAAMNVPFERRGRRLDDYIGGWRTLWEGGTDYASDHWSFTGVRVKPQPTERIPIWVGGASPGALRRAARSEGWQGTWAPIAVFAERLASLRTEMAAIGRDPGEVTISIHCEFRMDADPSGGGRWSEVGDGYGDRSMLGGSVDHVVDVLGDYVTVGLEHVLLVPIAGSREAWDDHVAAADEIRRRLTQT